MVATSLADLLAADVPDPTDFPPPAAAPGLRALDGALRCAICTEPFDAPVALTCGHCFCSMVRTVSSWLLLLPCAQTGTQSDVLTLPSVHALR